MRVFNRSAPMEGNFMITKVECRNCCNFVGALYPTHPLILILVHW